MFNRILVGLLLCAGVQQIVAGAHPVLSYLSFTFAALIAFNIVEDMIYDAATKYGKDNSIPTHDEED